MIVQCCYHTDGMYLHKKADQYDFTKVTASDVDGVQRGSTWQCCPGLLVYRRAA